MYTLSCRERQILNILYQRSRATAAEIQTTLPDPPSYSATRALLRIFERKGHVRHVAGGTTPPVYAAHLVAIARQVSQVAAVPMGERASLEPRVRPPGNGALSRAERTMRRCGVEVAMEMTSRLK
jgi:hypothetical protein